jgi:methylenetetrahydrofolate reductase (NADPH)
MLPFEPTEILAELAAHKAANPTCPIERVHFFPLGGIPATTDFTAAIAARPRRRA